MPAYCTDGQLRRSWKNLSATVDFDALQELRERVMGDIDAFLASAFAVPFNPWLRVVSVASNNLTLSVYDVSFLSVGDTIGWYDTSEKKMGATTTTVSGISGAVVAVAAAGSIAADDEIAVLTTGSRGDGTAVTWPGPPREVNARAVAMARYLATIEVTDLQEPTDAIVAGHEEAIAWLNRASIGEVEINGATDSLSGMCSTEGHAHSIDVDDETNWDHDPDKLGEIDTGRE